MEIHDDKIAEFRQLLHKRQIKELLDKLQAYLDGNAEYPDFYDKAHSISNIYEGISSAFQKGLNDPCRDDMFLSVCRSLSAVLDEMDDCYLRAHCSALQAAIKRCSKFDLTSIQNATPSKMENRERYDFYQMVFSSFLTMSIDNESTAKKWSMFVCSESNDYVLSCLIVSAVMLSTFYSSNIHKLILLKSVFENSTDRKIRQRAFVGMMMGYSVAPTSLQNQFVDGVSGTDELFKQYLVEFQKQIILCLVSERDSSMLDKELLKNLHTKDAAKRMIFRDDMEDSTLDEIIHSKADEEMTERIEKTMQKIMDMEKQGSDVYFGGFSKMKGFAFFHSLINWFIPFYVENPALLKVKDAFGNDALLQSIKKNSPFCESDKYSFAFGMGESINVFGEKFKNLFSGNIFLGKFDFLSDETMLDVWEKRRVMQDLYRFFRLSSFCDGMKNPFALPNEKFTNSLFLLNEKLVLEVVGLEGYLDICRFVSKNKVDAVAKFLFEYVKKSKLLNEAIRKNKEVGNEILLLRIHYLVSSADYRTALGELEALMPQLGGNLKVLKLYAKCKFCIEDYESAAMLYQQIVEQKPTKAMLLALAYSLLSIGKIEDAIKLLFRMEYEHPNNLEVVRALGWALLLRGDGKKAMDFQRKVFVITDASPEGRQIEDYYNLGLACWFTNDVMKAIKAFVLFANEQSLNSLVKKLDEDKALLEKYNKSETDKCLLLDLITEFCKK